MNLNFFQSYLIGNMDKVCLSGRMAESIKAAGKTVNNTERERTSARMVKNEKANGKKASELSGSRNHLKNEEERMRRGGERSLLYYLSLPLPIPIAYIHPSISSNATRMFYSIPTASLCR